MSITKELYYEELKNILMEEESEELHKISDELLDLNKEKIIPLTTKETYYLRYKLIHLLDGTNKKLPTSQISMIEIKKSLNNRIDYLKNKKDKLSSLDYLNKENININEIFDEQIEKILRKNKIYTIKDLLEIDKVSIRNLYLLGENSYDKIIRTIHEELSLIFIDEIPTEDRIIYLNNEYKKNKEKVINSNIDWLDFKKNKQKRLKSIGIKTIKDVVKNIERISNTEQSRNMLASYQIIKEIEQEDSLKNDRPEIKKEVLLTKYNYLLQKRRSTSGNKQEIDKELEKVIKELDNLKNIKIRTKKY